MKRQIITFLVISISLAGFTGYCYAWIDWIQDFRSGVYTSNVGEGLYETGALLIYTVGALRFMTRHLIK